MEVNLKINANCQLVATPIDNSPIETLLNPCLSDSEAVVFVEFLINPEIDNNKTVRVSETHDYYYYDLPQDGLYVYHKLKIFDKAYVEEDYQGLCYDTLNEKLFFKGVELKDIFENIEIETDKRVKVVILCCPSTTSTPMIGMVGTGGTSHRSSVISRPLSGAAP